MISGRAKDSAEMGMTEQQTERLAEERAEIAARVASFKATQEKFERERDEYFVTTLRNACATGPLPFWT
jgi:chorismate mutase